MAVTHIRAGTAQLKNFCLAITLYLDTENADHIGYITLYSISPQWTLYVAQVSQYYKALHSMGKKKVNLHISVLESEFV